MHKADAALSSKGNMFPASSHRHSGHPPGTYAQRRGCARSFYTATHIADKVTAPKFAPPPTHPSARSEPHHRYSFAPEQAGID